jgi:transposase
MWTTENRAKYNRDHLRYPSDVTDAEWAQIAPLIPPARRGGRRREVIARDLVNGLMYVLSTAGRMRCIRLELPVAVCSQGFAAQEHGVSLFLRLES